MKISHVLIVSLLVVQSLFAQIAIGYTHDADGKPINGYLNLHSHECNRKVYLFKIYSMPYMPGYYVDSDGNTKEGLIKIKKNGIKIKEKEGDEFGTEVATSELEKLVIGNDQFFTEDSFTYVKVITSSKFKDIEAKKPGFFNVVDTINDVVLARHMKTGSNGFDGQTFQLKTVTDTKWTHMPIDSTGFVNTLSRFLDPSVFADADISADELKNDDFFDVVKKVKFHEKYTSNTPILYNANWMQVRNQNESKYHAEIVSKQDSLWTLDYYEKEKKLFTVSYASLFPNVKQGAFKSYDAKGNIRELIMFENDKPTLTTVNDTTGNLYYSYNDKTIDKGKFKVPQIQYFNLIDSQGNDQVDTVYEEEFYDSISGNKVYRKFENGLLKYAKSGDYYQMNSTEHSLDVYKLSNKFNNTFLEYENRKKTILKDAVHGKIYVKFRVDASGRVEEYKVMNALGGKVDTIVGDFLKQQFGNKSKFKFKPLVFEGEKVKCEFVLPFEFKDYTSYSNKPDFLNNTRNWDAQWQLQQMMNQMMMHQMMRPMGF